MSSESPKPFRDGSLYAQVTMALLATGALLDVCLLTILFFGHPVAFLLSRLRQVVALLEGWAFLTWFDRSYANLEAIDGRCQHDRWAAVGGFLPPFVLFRPCEIMIEMWRRIARRGDSPLILFAWWIIFLSAPVFYYVDLIKTAYLALVISASLAFILVRRITDGLAKAAASMPPPAPAPKVEPPRTPATPAVLAPQLAAIEAAAKERRQAALAAQPARSEVIEAPPAPPVQHSIGPPRQVIVPKPVSPPWESERIAAPASGVRPAPRPQPRTLDREPRPSTQHNLLQVRLMALVLAIAGIAMLTIAAHVAFEGDDVSRILCAIYGAAGVLLLLFAAVFARHRPASAASESWGLIAITASVVVAANVIVLIGTFVR